jgi:hypothetical protein
MAKLTADEQKLLDELTERANSADEEDYEIEIYDTSKGRGARIPVSKGKGWLFENFGLGENPNPPEETKNGPAGKSPRAAGESSISEPRHYFSGNKAPSGD